MSVILFIVLVWVIGITAMIVGIRMGFSEMYLLYVSILCTIGTFYGIFGL